MEDVVALSGTRLLGGEAGGPEPVVVLTWGRTESEVDYEGLAVRVTQVASNAGIALSGLVALKNLAEGVGPGIGAALAELVMLDVADRTPVFGKSWRERRIAQFDSGQSLRIVPRPADDLAHELRAMEVEELVRRCGVLGSGLVGFELAARTRPGVIEVRRFLTSHAWFEDWKDAAEAVLAEDSRSLALTDSKALTIAEVAEEGGYVFEAIWRLAIGRAQMTLGRPGESSRRDQGVYLVGRAVVS